MSVTIITNNIPRNIVDASELTAAERREFDYLDWEAIDKGEGSAEFFRYLGRVYDLGEFMATRGSETLEDWHGYSADTFFSGILVRYSSDNEQVIIGRYYS